MAVKAVLAACASLSIAGALLATGGCMPTYPREKLADAVKDVCKIEYGMDVDVTLIGTTMGIYYPMKGLLDAGMGISEEAWDNISNLLLIASRVGLSTDADMMFYCVIAQDARMPELQVVIIKYVDDVKRAMYRNISRSEAFKRTLFTINLTPQAKKERSIEKIFENLGVEESIREKVMDEFFRSPPTKLSDVGYWRENFYLKEIAMEEFLAAQIANRVKIGFGADKELKKMFAYKSAEGLFGSDEGLRFFLIKYKIADIAGAGEVTELHKRKIGEIIRVASKVVGGYKFEDFDVLLLEDQLENVKLTVSGQDVRDFEKKRLSVEEIVRAPAGYF